jgi:aryl-alcohol dehydrogenase-like predicted oxidoreductase
LTSGTPLTYHYRSQAETIHKHCKTSLANLQFDSIELLQLYHYNVGRVNQKTGVAQPSIGDQMAGLKAVQVIPTAQHPGCHDCDS